jgi:hypothetical protein
MQGIQRRMRHQCPVMIIFHILLNGAILLLKQTTPFKSMYGRLGFITIYCYSYYYCTAYMRVTALYGTGLAMSGTLLTGTKHN